MDRDENISMASIIEQMDAGVETPEEPFLRRAQRGEMVDGTIASIDRDGILVDIGAKSEGMVAASEIPLLLGSANPPQVGESVIAYVLRGEDREGRMLLSLLRGREEQGWRTAEQLYGSGAIFEAQIREANRGGLIIDLHGLRGFVPMSQLSGVRHDAADQEATMAALQAMVGQTLPVKVLELNRRRNRLILSERIAAQERRGRRKDELIAELREGEVRQGRVTSVTDFGAFVDIGGADGLVHLSELSWTRVGRASDVVKVNDVVDVMVLGVDRENKKIALSLRRTQPEPWAVLAQKYHPGDIVEGTITKLAAFGAFARIEDGIEGLIHISELSDGHVGNPRNVVEEGERRRMRVLRVEPERRRLGLSLRGIQPLVEEQPVEELPYTYSYQPDENAGPTIGDHFRWQQQDDDEDAQPSRR